MKEIPWHIKTISDQILDLLTPHRENGDVANLMRYSRPYSGITVFRKCQ